MFKMRPTYVINCQDIEKVTGKHWGDYEFAQLAENGSYQPIYLGDDNLEDRYEDLEWAEHKGDNGYAKRLRNQIELIEMLRKQGYKDMILVHVDW